MVTRCDPDAAPRSPASTCRATSPALTCTLLFLPADGCEWVATTGFRVK